MKGSELTSVASNHLSISSSSAYPAVLIAEWRKCRLVLKAETTRFCFITSLRWFKSDLGLRSTSGTERRFTEPDL